MYIALLAGALLCVVDRPPVRNVRTVTFRAHLDGDVATDPVVHRSESLSVVPAANEPLNARNPVSVVLPDKTPYKGEKQVYYLQGYAVGFMIAVNAPELVFC